MKAKAFLSRLLVAVGLLAAGAATFGCHVVVWDEPQAPDDFLLD